MSERFVMKAPELPIFKTVDPETRTKVGWAFWCLGEIHWFPRLRDAENERVKLLEGKDEHSIR